MTRYSQTSESLTHAVSHDAEQDHKQVSPHPMKSDQPGSRRYAARGPDDPSSIITALARASVTNAMPATIAEIFDIGFDPSAPHHTVPMFSLAPVFFEASSCSCWPAAPAGPARKRSPATAAQPAETGSAISATRSSSPATHSARSSSSSTRKHYQIQNITNYCCSTSAASGNVCALWVASLAARSG